LAEENGAAVGTGSHGLHLNNHNYRLEIGMSGSGIQRYEYRLDGGSPVSMGTTKPFTISGLSPASDYDIQIRARDRAGNYSPWSSIVTGTTSDSAVPFLDGLTMTVPYWYGFAKRRTAYAGKCIRVKNLTTNTQTDVDFDADGRIDRSALAGLVSGAQVLGIQKYYDQSGNGLDLTVGSVYDTIDLSGHRVGVSTGSSASLANGYTSAGNANLVNPVFFSAVNFYNYGQSFLFDHGGGNHFSARNLAGTVPAGKQIYMNNGSVIQSDEPLTYGTVASDGVRVVVHRFKSGNDEAWRDGVALTFTGTTNAGDTPRNETVTFHDFAGGGGLGWSGQYFEFGCLDGTYSGTERSTVQAALQADIQDGPLVVFLGDSKSYGQTTANVYTDGPAAKYKEIMPNGRDVCNRGYAGYTIDGPTTPNIASIVTDHITPLVRSTASRVIFVVNGGTNDAVTDSATGATIASRMQTLVGTLKALGSNVEVYIRTIEKQNAWPGSWAAMQAANALFIANGASWGADGVIDITGDADIGDAASTATGFYTGDDVHLSATGYAKLATYIDAAIA
jgi:lysophospholipase L1-like esterase